MSRSVRGCSNSDQALPRNLREIQPKDYTRCHLDEMVVSIAGRQMYMWRAIDSEGEVLEILVQPQRDKAAAVRLLRKLLRRQGFVPTVIVTHKLRSYGVALRAALAFGVPISRRPTPGAASKQDLDKRQTIWTCPAKVESHPL
jgi:transposase-like protein